MRVLLLGFSFRLLLSSTFTRSFRVTPDGGSSLRFQFLKPRRFPCRFCGHLFWADVFFLSLCLGQPLVFTTFGVSIYGQECGFFQLVLSVVEPERVGYGNRHATVCRLILFVFFFFIFYGELKQVSLRFFVIIFFSFLEDFKKVRLAIPLREYHIQHFSFLLFWWIKELPRSLGAYCQFLISKSQNTRKRLGALLTSLLWSRSVKISRRYSEFVILFTRKGIEIWATLANWVIWFKIFGR